MNTSSRLGMKRAPTNRNVSSTSNGIYVTNGNATRAGVIHESANLDVVATLDAPTPMNALQIALGNQDSEILSMPSPPMLPDIPDDYELVLQKKKEAKKKRGRTTLKQSVWKLKEGEAFEIIVNENGNPVKGECKKLSLYIGMEARTIPCIYKTWRNVPAFLKDEIYDNVKAKFKFVGAECYERVMTIARNAWRLEKKHIRDNLVIGHTLTDALINIPLGCDKEAWETCCIDWLSNDFGAYCDKRTNARKNVKLHHSMGPNSFEFVAANCDEEGEELFKKMYTSKDGKLNDAAKSIIESIDEEMKKFPPCISLEAMHAARRNAFINASTIVEKRKKTHKVWATKSFGSPDSEGLIKAMERKWEEERQSLMEQLKIEKQERADYEKKMESRMKILEECMNGRGYKPAFVDSDDTIPPDTDAEPLGNLALDLNLEEDMNEMYKY